MAIPVKKAAAEVEKFAKGLNNIARELLREEGDELIKYIRRTKFRRGGPPDPSFIVSRTGTMERSLTTVVKFQGNGLLLEITMEGVTPAAAPSVEDGSRSYTIRPKRARVLAFMVNNRLVFTQRVRHPGIRARRVLSRSFEERSTAIVRRLEKNMEREWEELFA